MHLTTAEKIERLDNLERVVRALPRGDLNMDTWSCGTARCALGAAMYDPWFQERGLKPSDIDPISPCPEYCGFVGFGAGREFFGIEHPDALELFAPDVYPPHARWRGIRPSDVIKRIRSMKKRIQKEAGINVSTSVK